MTTIRTKLVGYFFDTRNEAEREAYKALAASLKAQGLVCFETWGGSHYDARWKNGVDVDLEVEHLFDNQWNTAPSEETSDKGYRVFDWAQDYPINFDPRIKRGHYLIITDEMREARRNTLKCRYCGKQEPAQKGYVFCPHCRGSEHLKEADLYLTRMMRVDDKSSPAPLSDAERAHLVPLWRDDQISGNSARGKARMAKARASVKEQFDSAIRKAEFKRDVATWCLDNGLMPDIAIAYDHTGRVCFGWNKPVDDETLARLLDIVSELPWSYDIKTADGRTLSGEH